MENESLSLTAIIGIVGALLTVLIKLFDTISSWRKSRESAKNEQREIDNIHKEVNFINAWLSAVENSASEQELVSRRKQALERLDQLLVNNQQAVESQKSELQTNTVSKRQQINNIGFYAISVFMVLGVLGLFVDDDDNWSYSYFEQNLDVDTLVGFGFILVIWVYFFVNSRFFSKK